MLANAKSNICSTTLGIAGVQLDIVSGAQSHILVSGSQRWMDHAPDFVSGVVWRYIRHYRLMEIWFL